MRNDQIFVLLLVILLPMSGCFDSAVGDAEGTDDATDGASDTGDGTTSESSQSRIWYSSGDVVNKYWNDGQNIGSGYQRCLEYGSSYDSDNGEYIGEECKETGYPQSLSDWNGTGCQGTLVTFGQDPRYAPECKIILTTISTNSGEALILYEMKSVTVKSTCGLASSSISYFTSEYLILPGSALACEHEVYSIHYYTKSSSSNINDMEILSLVYAIQETTVV